ncbi:MAG: CBS domain-containing protein [Spirochaetota bacterium]|nr:CBS domain-containing protein [Spirochaetota bacterium]
MYIKEYMNTNVITVNSGTLIHDAEKIMRDHKIRRLPVVDKGELVGIVTKDRIREATITPATSLGVWELNYLLAKMKVKDVMVTSLYTVNPDTPLEKAITEAHEQGIGTLLVVEKNDPKRLLGIATTTDLYKVTTTLLGFGEKGVHLHIINPSESGSVQEVLSMIIEQEGKINSMFTIIPPGKEKEDCIIHLDIADADQIIKKLKSKGYEIEERAR